LARNNKRRKSAAGENEEPAAEKEPAAGENRRHKKRSRKKKQKGSGSAAAAEAGEQVESSPRSSDWPPVGDPGVDEPPVVDVDDDQPAVVDLDADADADEEVAALIAEAVTTAPSAEEHARRLADLGPISSPEIRSRLLAEALAHAEHKDARYRVPFPETPTAGRWKAVVALLILLVAGVVSLAPPGWAAPDPPAPLTAAERLRSLRVALLLQAEQVEAFRVREQRLPVTLEEVAAAFPGVRYVRSGTRSYQLIAYLPDGSAVVYDSTSPASAFAALEPAWRLQEGAP
jgi:hypothetical protein